ncbi:MAG: dethiobiotin synthase [Planctomycetes bacterium]|nr:dethiobiotin synthase [Planctomycetota bacterium]
MAKSLFITGTDTDSGKTVITCGIARMLKRKGYSVGVMKPVASGCFERDGLLVSDDSIKLKKAAQSLDPMRVITPIALEHPLSPHMSARMDGVLMPKDHISRLIREAFEILASEHDIVIVEGVGGLLVPICDNYTIGDIASELGLDTIIVARDRLGMINHTLLTVEAAQKRNMKVNGIILNCVNEPDYAAVTNAEAMSYTTSIPVIESIPNQADPYDFDKVADALEGAGVMKIIGDLPDIETEILK